MADATCSIIQCHKRHFARGWCQNHYEMWRRWGDPYRTPPTPTERFWAKFVRLDSGCWQWTGAMTPQGYGHLRTGGRHVGAHRFAYELLVGPIPAGLHIDHLCMNPSCCNPAHLEPVTQEENNRRMMAARCAKAEGVLDRHTDHRR